MSIPLNLDAQAHPAASAAAWLSGLSFRPTGPAPEELEIAQRRVSQGSAVVVGRLPGHESARAFRLLTRALVGVAIDPDSIAWILVDRREAGGLMENIKGSDRFLVIEAIAEAAARNLRVTEVPALEEGGAARAANSSGGGFLEDLRALLVVRRRLGMGYLDKSPVYWTRAGYGMAEILLGESPGRVLADVAARIPAGSSVTDLCCGPATLFTRYLAAKACTYVGMDFNAHFLGGLRRRGVDARFVRLPGDPIASADYVVMCSSFYHFRDCEGELLTRMRRAARRAVIVSEPIENVSNHPVKWLARLANHLTNPGIGAYSFQHDLASLRAFAKQHGASEFMARPGSPNAIAVFEALA